MATKNTNLSKVNKAGLPSGKKMKIGIVVAEWNSKITYLLRDGAIKALKETGVKESDIIIEYVPGAVELTFAARLMAEYSEVNAILVFGCVIQGETPHFDYVCQSVTYGITELNLSYDVPVIFGLLTVRNLQQAIDRAGGKYGNKGEECAMAAVKMAAISAKFSNQ